MSADPDGGTNKTPGFVPLGSDQDGRQMLAMPYNESLAQKAVEEGLAAKTEPEPDQSGETPDPESDKTTVSRNEGGPIRRFNDVFTDLGSVQLEAIGLDGYEIANATSTLRDEMYRSNFPIIQPRFTKKCADDSCGAEYDKDVDFCIQCAREEMMEKGADNPPNDPEEIPKVYRNHPVRAPSLSQKRDAQRLAESVNKEGQSLRELMKMEEDDQSRLGVSTVVVKKEYAVATGDSAFYDRGEMIYEGPDEIIRGDPKRIVPVVDENSRVGNHWWACPVHRGKKVKRNEYENGHVNCEECGASLREVYFAEMKGASRSHSKDAAKVYFQDEVVTWARYHPRLHGLDGLSPIHHIWLKQAILHWMDIYGAAFFDPESDRYPNKFMVVHTTNPQAWEKQFQKAEADASEHPYSEQILMNEYSGESNSTPEVQVIDLMQDDLLGQNDQLRDRYKQDIRSNFGVTSIFDSELKDAGGLNNEGLQLEVTDRTIASAMRDLVAGPLDELSKRLGITDYMFEFVPPQDVDLDELKESVKVGKDAADAGLDASLEDGRIKVDDGDFEASEGDDGGGLGALFNGDFAGLDDVVSHKAEGQAVDVYRIVAPEDGDFESDLLGLAVDMPEHDVYVDWHLDAWGDDRLSEAHVSIYGNMEDLETVAEGTLELLDTVESPAEFEAVEASARDADAPKSDEADRAGETPPEDAAEHDGTERTPSTKKAKGETERKRRPESAEGNVSGPSESALGPEQREKLEDLRQLDKAFEHIVWAQGEQQKAEPFWDEDDVVPDFVAEVIQDVALDALWDSDFASIPGALDINMADILTESLTQPQGWSLSSITENIADAFGADRDGAELVGRTETAKILNEAREEGYKRVGALEGEGDADPRLFRWVGPGDHRTTDACEELKRLTKDGVTFERLIELQKEITEEYFPSLDYRKHCLHPNERHTFLLTSKLDHAAAAGPIEVEHKMDLAPAMSGTFEVVA